MGVWNFYHSGILYGQIKKTETGLVHRILISETAQLSDWKGFDDGKFYEGLCHRDIHAFIHSLPVYDSFVKQNLETFVTESGEQFDLRRTSSYIQRHVKFPKDLLVADNRIFAVIMCGRECTSILVEDGREDETPLAPWKQVYPSPIHQVSFHGVFMVNTRDGEMLATNVYLPGDVNAPVPSVLVRTPYGKDINTQQYYRFVQRGYAVVVQDVRGREDSTGEWLPNYYEVEDGDDTLNWIAAQSWSDGQVSMTGGSYLGYVQWAAAASGNPHLKAMLSSVCAGSAFVDIPRRGGCFNSGMLAWGFAMTEQRMCPERMVRDDWDEVLNIRPLKEIPLRALGHDVPFLSKWLEHKDYDDLWKRSSWKERSRGMVVPTLITSGWFDDNGMGTTEALELISHYPPENCKVILGPWMHSGNANYDLHGVYLGEDALRYDIDLIAFQWLEHFLKGIDNGIQHSAPVEYYTLGSNCWNTANSWPVPQVTPVPCYLSASPDRLSDGLLTFTEPAAAGEYSYDYDPKNPSTHIVDMSENELEVPENYTLEEKRPDVLCFSTPPLTEEVTVTGDIQVMLYVSSDCPDTDFVVRLTDVDPKGTSIKLADSVISARYRNGFETPEFMELKTVYKIPMRTTKISNTFQKGHRIRFTITSSANNFIFPNSNTKDGFDSKEVRIAHNTIHFGGVSPSHIILPIMPCK